MGLQSIPFPLKHPQALPGSDSWTREGLEGSLEPRGTASKPGTETGSHL